MEQEGYWLNAVTGEFCEIDEHARWISERANAERIGLAPRLHRLIEGLDWQDERLRILLPAMRGGLVRVRRQDGDITFEFTLRIERVVELIARFLEKSDLPGPFSIIKLHDLRKGEGIAVSWADMQERLRAGPEALIQLVESANDLTCRRKEINAINAELDRRHLHERPPLAEGPAEQASPGCIWQLLEEEGKSFSLISVGEPGMDVEQIQAWLSALVRDVRNRGFGYVHMRAGYVNEVTGQTTFRPSLLVLGTQRGMAVYLGSRHGCSTVLHKGPETKHHHTHEFLFEVCCEGEERARIVERCARSHLPGVFAAATMDLLRKYYDARSPEGMNFSFLEECDTGSLGQTWYKDHGKSPVNWIRILEERNIDRERLRAESSLGTIWRDLADPDRIFGIVSVGLPGMETEEQNGGLSELIGKVREMGHGFTELRAGYTSSAANGAKAAAYEPGLLIAGITRKQAVGLGEHLGQPSVLHKSTEEFVEVGAGHSGRARGQVLQQHTMSDRAGDTTAPKEIVRRYYSRRAGEASGEWAFRTLEEHEGEALSRVWYGNRERFPLRWYLVLLNEEHDGADTGGSAGGSL